MSLLTRWSPNYVSYLDHRVRRWEDARRRRAVPAADLVMTSDDDLLMARSASMLRSGANPWDQMLPAPPQLASRLLTLRRVSAAHPVERDEVVTVYEDGTEERLARADYFDAARTCTGPAAVSSLHAGVFSHGIDRIHVRPAPGGGDPRWDLAESLDAAVAACKESRFAWGLALRRLLATSDWWIVPVGSTNATPVQLPVLTRRSLELADDRVVLHVAAGRRRSTVLDTRGAAPRSLNTIDLARLVDGQTAALAVPTAGDAARLTALDRDDERVLDVPVAVATTVREDNARLARTQVELVAGALPRRAELNAFCLSFGAEDDEWSIAGRSVHGDGELVGMVHTAAAVLIRVPDGPVLELAAERVVQDAVPASLTEAFATTRQIAASVLTTGVEPDDQLRMHVAERIRRSPTRLLVDDRTMLLLSPEHLLQATGWTGIARVAADVVISAGPGSDPAAFGAVLTVLAAHALSTEYPSSQLHSWMLTLVHEWITGAINRPWRTPRAHLVLRAFSAVERGRLLALLDHAPWLARHVDGNRAEPLPRFRVDGEQALVVLLCSRPQLQWRVEEHQNRPRVAYSYVTVTGPLARSLADGFVLPDDLDRLIDAAQSGGSDLDGLASALEEAVRSPGACLSLLSTLELPAAVAAGTRAIVEALGGQITGRAADLLTIWDVPGSPELPDVLVVNTSADTALSVASGARSLMLGPFAPHLNTARYAVHLVDVAPDQPLIVGTETIALRPPPRLPAAAPAHSAATDISTLFRGRRHELGRLRTIIAERGEGRRAGLIHGVRRAGKTTLAKRACELALHDGLIGGWGVLDVSVAADGVDDAPLGTLLVEWLRRVAATHLRLDLVPDAGAVDDPLLFLQQLDAASARRPVAIVLDELDYLLVHGEESPERRLAQRLGNATWRNLTLIGTAQRFHASSVEFKEWSVIECPPDLTVEDGITYFCDPLLDAGAGPRAVRLNRTSVTPQLFHTAVGTRLGLRPSLWRALRNLLGSGPVDGRFLRGRGEIDAAIDGVFVEDVQIGLPLVSDNGLSMVERRRRDLFSDDERRVLALFAGLPKGRSRIGLKKAQEISRPGVQELLDRCHLQLVQNDQLEMAVPLFGEFVSRNRNGFLQYL